MINKLQVRLEWFYIIDNRDKLYIWEDLCANDIGMFLSI